MIPNYPRGLQSFLELAIEFIWWVDDGDNVYEDDETLLPSGDLGQLGVGNTDTRVIADSTGAVTGLTPLTSDGAVEGETTYYIGKAWCFGDFTLSPVTAGAGENPGVDPGFTCSGSSATNVSQSDSMTLTVAFTAIQERNNLSYTCPTTP